ncbi:flagellar hook-associated protein FlgK [Wukongibacter baidiensis]|uniref:flagellar hook-associated protein FlgK n=1 Tax=Wukongibacter baidiensis TaxID=1723361 RepID=UPI003D7F376F
MSTFFGFNIARSGIFASQRAMNITSHNIANANTPGYTRQRLDMEQSSPMYLPGGQGMLGAGVDTEGISQLRSEFLDLKLRNELTGYGEWETKSETLATIGTILNEPSDSGIQTVFNDFFSSLQELVDTPESLTTRALVRESAVAFTTRINGMVNQFEDLQSNMDFEVRATVDQINGYGEQIASLNEAIHKAELDGSKANDLRDQRNLLVDKLSELTDINYYEDAENRFYVLMNGKPLVSHIENSELAYVQRTTKLHDPYDANGLHDVQWADGSTFNPTGGKIKGLTDMINNDSGNDKGIPYYVKQLNDFTRTLADEMNRVHRLGFDLDGNAGGDFFTFDPTNPAKSISISAAIEGDLNKIAASETVGGVPGDGGNALAMADVRHNSGLFAWGSPEDFLNSLISNLGVDGQEANRMVENQEVMLNQIETNRQSISGVSMDEEMTNMIQFQHSFNANSRMITTIDEMIETIINRMGVVGR